MLEYVVIFNDKQRKSIKIFASKFKGKYKDKKFVLAFYKNQLLFSCLEKEFLLSFLLDLSKYIYKYYKTCNIINPLKLSIIKDKTMIMILKRLILYFDCKFEIKYVFGRILGYSHVNLDGFYNFELTALVSKWNMLIKTLKENNELLQNIQYVKELICYLRTEITSKIKSVSITIKDNKYIIKDDKNNEIIINNKNYSKPQDLNNMLNFLIYLSPQYVNAQSIKQKKVRQALTKIF